MKVKLDQQSKRTTDEKCSATLGTFSVPPHTNLSTLHQIRREMVALYRAAREGEISHEDLKNLVYALSQIAKLIEIGRIERRMEILEKLTSATELTH